MRQGGFCLIGLGLFFYGLVPTLIPVSLVVGGIAALIFDHEFKI